MPKSSNAMRFVGTADSLREPIARALAEAGMKPPTAADDGSWYRSGTGTSLWSWGENVTVWVQDDGHGALVTVESKSSFGLTLVDWGKNNKNVAKFLEKLSQHARLEAG